ncbi:AAEL001130-PA [Aedes aegypti]|uniref:alpha-amylase n=2 Tax=Aedes aegypti TaxID=7159 RepID=A0A1S4EXW1_AEDAE|nr:alpha-amylase 4N [Aedes aegypti]EAT47782.1 AAEL001130-PA [Aedes aegypti]
MLGLPFGVLLTVLPPFLVAQFNPYFPKDSSGVIVHLLEWTFEDVASECVLYLAPNGINAVQVSPINEVRIMPNRSWRERYEPVSYRMTSRSGNESQFQSMVQTCNKAGVRVFVEVVLNNMAGGSGPIKGTGGAVANPSKREYPDVPFSDADFNEACTVLDGSDPHEVRNCQVDDLPDLNQGLARVRQRMIDFMNKLIRMGVAGFYVNSAKNIWPHDLGAIYMKLENLSSSSIPGVPAGSRPFIYHDIADFGEGGSRKNEYTLMGFATEYRFAYELADVMFKRKPFHYMVNLGTRLGYIPRERSVVFLDTPSLQRLSDVADAPLIITSKHLRIYKIATVFMMAHRYGTPRIMSSFRFSDIDEGPPSDGRGKISKIILNDQDQCTGGWICEHRWKVVQRMLKFRKEVSGQPVINWVDNGQNQVAFCRGKVGFVAINAEISLALKANLFTCLKAGTYCDIISGALKGKACTGLTVKVGGDGRADIYISSAVEEPFIVLLASEKI